MRCSIATFTLRLTFSTLDISIRVQYGDQAEALIERIKIWFKEKYPQPANPVIAALQAQQERPPHIDQHEWRLLQRARELNAPVNQADLVTDFDRYFNNPMVTTWDASVEDFNLQWWKAMEFQYPMVAKAARDLLAIPSAEVDIERLFLKGRDIIGIRRMALDADTMRILRLLKSHFDEQDKEIKAKARAQLEGSNASME